MVRRIISYDVSVRIVLEDVRIRRSKNEYEMGLRTYYIALHFNSNTLHEEIRGEGSLGPFAIEHLEVLLHDSNLLLLQ